MEKTGLAAVGKYVMRDKQHLGCLRIREGVITLEKLFFHDEIRPVKEIAPRKAKVPEAELKMATSLIAQFKTSFEPERYDDTYRDALMKVIKAKQKGETITAVPCGGGRGARRPARCVEGVGRGREEGQALGPERTSRPAEAGVAQAQDREALDGASRRHHCLRLPFSGGVLVMWKARQRPQR